RNVHRVARQTSQRRVAVVNGTLAACAVSATSTRADGMPHRLAMHSTHSDASVIVVATRVASSSDAPLIGGTIAGRALRSVSRGGRGTAYIYFFLLRGPET